MIGCTTFLLGKLGEMADLWDIYIDGQLYEGGYGTVEIAERAARAAIDALETEHSIELRRDRARTMYRQDMSRYDARQNNAGDYVTEDDV